VYTRPSRPPLHGPNRLTVATVTCDAPVPETVHSSWVEFARQRTCRGPLSGCRAVCRGAQDVLYGVFNDDSDDGQAGRGGAGVGKRTKDFKTPVAFVSSGVQGSAAPQEDVMDVDEDDPFSRPKGLGLGASVNPSTTATPSEKHRQPSPPPPAPPLPACRAWRVARASGQHGTSVRCMLCGCTPVGELLRI
jgi:hypothetical protein